MKSTDRKYGYNHNEETFTNRAESKIRNRTKTSKRYRDANLHDGRNTTKLQTTILFKKQTVIL